MKHLRNYVKFLWHLPFKVFPNCISKIMWPLGLCLSALALFKWSIKRLYNRIFNGHKRFIVYFRLLMPWKERVLFFCIKKTKKRLLIIVETYFVSHVICGEYFNSSSVSTYPFTPSPTQFDFSVQVICEGRVFLTYVYMVFIFYDRVKPLFPN